MIRILRRYSINCQSVKKELLNNKIQVDPRYAKTILEFDGSMTKFVINMTGQGSRPLVKIISQKKINLKQDEQPFKEGMQGYPLFDLGKVFRVQKEKDLKDKYLPFHLIERSIEFYITREMSSSEPQLLYFARSFWDEQKYNLIMSKSISKPIGLNLIDQQVSIFRKINWTGLVDLQVSINPDQKHSKTYRNLCSRSYTMINNGQPLCELEEFFLPQMFDIFEVKKFD